MINDVCDEQQWHEARERERGRKKGILLAAERDRGIE